MGSAFIYRGGQICTVWAMEHSPYVVLKQILTDRGTQFYAVRGNASTFDMYLEEWGVKHILAGVRHPQTNGKVERVIRTFKEECLNKTEWTKDTGIKKKKRIVIIPY